MFPDPIRLVLQRWVLHISTFQPHFVFLCSCQFWDGNSSIACKRWCVGVYNFLAWCINIVASLLSCLSIDDFGGIVVSRSVSENLWVLYIGLQELVVYMLKKCVWGRCHRLAQSAKRLVCTQWGRTVTWSCQRTLKRGIDLMLRNQTQTLSFTDRWRLSIFHCCQYEYTHFWKSIRCALGPLISHFSLPTENKYLMWRDPLSVLWFQLKELCTDLPT